MASEIITALQQTTQQGTGSATDATTVAEAAKKLDESRFVIADSKFRTPDMGDYYIGQVDDTYLSILNKAVTGNEEDGAKKAAFYTETPAVTTPGYYPDLGVYFFKARVNITADDLEFGIIDGDTIQVSASDVDNGGDERITEHINQSIDASIKAMTRAAGASSSQSSDYFRIRFLGIDAPEIPHWSKEANADPSLYETKRVKLGLAKSMPNCLYVKGENRSDEQEVDFVRIGDAGGWYEYKERANSRGGKDIIWLSQDETEPETYEQGIAARDTVCSTIQNAGNEIYIMLDATSINRSASEYPRTYGSKKYEGGVLNALRQFADSVKDPNDYKSAGFNLLGQDTYRRFLGTVYLKINDQWINLAKRLIVDYDKIVINKSFRDMPTYDNLNGMSSSAFNLDSYEWNDKVWADAIWNTSKKFDDRREIQQKLFGNTFESLKEWTVAIGDTMLYVPPTSIRCITQSTAERMPLLRAKGSMAKSAEKSERLLQLSLYFNNERGINGYEYSTTTPSGNSITYYLNGLRSLIAQFKFTPFLPIDSDYINTVLGIEAVTLIDMKVNTVPGFPRLLQATLTLQEFIYRVYMPEVPVQREEDSEYRNYFAGCINFETMRYYYQRSIQAGQDLAAKEVAFNSKEYMEATLGNRTALLPMKFTDPKIKFYIANETYLKKMLQTKIEAMRKANATIVLSKSEKQGAADIAYIYNQVKAMISESTFTSALADLNTVSSDEAIGSSMWRTLYPYTETSNKDLADTKLSILKSDGSRYSIGSNTLLMTNLNETLHRMRASMNTINAAAGKTIISDIDLAYKEEEVSPKTRTGARKGRISVGVSITTQLDYFKTDAEFRDMKRDASLYIGESVDKFFVDRKLFIPLVIDLEATSYATADSIQLPKADVFIGQKFYFDSNSPDVKFLGYCADLAAAKEDANSENITRKQSIDYEKLNSIIFDPYDVGNARVTNMDVSFGNNFAKIGVTSMDGYAPQYVGGQDTEINIEIQTTSLETVAMLNALPKLSSYYAREYRLVLPCWPLKLESELTAFFGINETLVESVTVDTIPGRTGLYTVYMHLISVDRTLRNREALKRIEANNAGYQGIAARSSTNNRSYFELQDVLAEAELYPDLELPTIKELMADGFQFVRYKFQDTRVYPDPDFYFVYPHILTSQFTRETVIGSIKNNFDDIQWVDKTGGTVKTKIAEGTGITPYDYNDVAKKQIESKRAVDAAQAKQMADSASNTAKAKDNDLLNVLNAADAHESWNACADIKCIFLEKKYQLELDAYKSFIKHQEAIKDVNAKASTNTKPIEGKWAYDSMAKALESSALIKKYLEETKIAEKAEVYYRTPQYDARLNVVTVIKKYLQDDKICEIMNGLNIENTGTFQDIVAEIVYAAACAATAPKEFAGKTNDIAWKPKPSFVGVRLGGAQDKGIKDLTNSVDDAIENAVEFGPFRIKMYTKDELIKITGEEVADMWIDYADGVNTRRYLIDPYYRKAITTVEEVREYKKGCIGNTEYAAVAYFRIMLYWLKHLIDSNAIPTISTDILRKAAKNELDIISKIKTYVANSSSGSIEKHISFFLKNSHALDAGKFFAAAALASTAGSSMIREKITKRDYKGLNGYLQGCSMPTNNIDPSDATSLTMRKMMLALVGIGRIKNFNAIGVSPTNPATEFIQDINEKMYLQAAEDPAQFIMHSFHDMVVNDVRGRMLKAFPAFYLLFIDEGREIGAWKLHDNFYNTSSIAEIQVVKSRKVAADTARIVMSNMYKSYTTDDEDSKISYNTDWNDVVDSIFSPRVYALREEAKRSKNPASERIRLRAGARIHIRMGYGSNAATLPIVFNGCIAEVQAGEAVELIAQGDGIELMNPILENDEAHEIQYKDSLRGLFTNGATPKTILNSLLTTSGGILRNILKDTEYAHLLGRNPYGLYHFGDPDNKEIFRGGETIQNIYEAMSRPVWGEKGTVSDQYATDEAPKITFDVFGKTMWDIMHICQSVSPDFVTAVAPFAFRSTVFHGAPRYYCAYDYIKKNEVLIEKRKPFQQFHIYSSLTDIIKNNITASDKDVKTCAVGLYQMAETGNFKSQHRCGPLWVDVEIYPENQKTMIVDTQLYGKGIPIVGFYTNSITNRLTDWFADDKGSVTSHEKIAWRMTANALKNTVKDMYQGDLIILGDPTVKPYDRMFINDVYENITGQCLVKEVVHNFSANSGYTTSVYPDAIAVVDDRFELAIQSAGNAIFSTQALMNGALIWTTSMAFGGPAAALGKGLESIASKSGSLLSKGASAVEKAGVNGAVSKMRTALAAVRAVLPASGAIAGAGSVAAASSTAAIASAVLLNVAIIGTVVLVGAYVAESITRWAKNLQVLQIFPLKKHGLVMTAGLDGNKGLVYGSPTYNNVGLLKGLYSNLTAGSFNNWTDGILGFAQDYLISDEMKNIGNKYKRDAKLIDDTGNPVADERMFLKSLKAVAAGQGTNSTGYQSSQLLPRIAVNNNKQVKEAYDRYAMLDIERIQSDPKLQSNQLISMDQRLKPYIDENFFKIIHEQETLKVNDDTTQSIILSIGGQTITTKLLIGTNKDGTKYKDLALLNKDALNILYEIVKRAKEKMPATDASDKYQAFEDTKKSFIMLKAALRVGDKDTLSCTGFSFVLQGIDKAVDPLTSAIKDLQAKIAEDYKGNAMLAPELFKSETAANGEVVITVLLPNVSTTRNSTEETTTA